MAGQGATAPASGSAQAVASAGASISATLKVLDAAKQQLIEAALARCADDARSEVVIHFLKGRRPTPEECHRQVVDEESGRRMTLAMLLGCKMHRAAQRCANDQLAQLRPGGFSLEQRYRYTRETGALELVSAQETQELIHRGCGVELKGTLVPDVVLHQGNPLWVQAVYDFKFPCANTDTIPGWTIYKNGPHEGLSQRSLYREALKTNEIWRIVPRLGVVR